MLVSSMRWVSVFKGWKVGVHLKLGARPRHFFFLFFLSLRRVLSLCFFSTKMLIISSHLSFFWILMIKIIIIRKPTLFLCSFHNNDNKCLVGSKKKNARTPHALDITEIYLIIISLCFTFAELVNDIFLSVKSSCALVSGNTNKSLRPKEGVTDWATKRVNSLSLI